MKDRLDGLKLELKEHPVGSQQLEEVKNKIKDLTKQIDDFIQTILLKIPSIKQKGLDAREKQIEEDLRIDEAAEHSARLGPNLEEEAAVLGSFGAFMPRTNFDEPNIREVNRVEETSSGMDQEQGDADDVCTDNYLTGVESENIEIMEKMRFLADRYKCREQILQALKRYRIRDERLVTLENLKLLENPKAKSRAVVAMDQDT